MLPCCAWLLPSRLEATCVHPEGPLPHRPPLMGPSQPPPHCASLSAPPPPPPPLQYEYLWADGVKVKKPLQLSAPDYISKLFDWIDDQVSARAVGVGVGGRRGGRGGAQERGCGIGAGDPQGRWREHGVVGGYRWGGNAQPRRGGGTGSHGRCVLVMVMVMPAHARPPPAPPPPHRAVCRLTTTRSSRSSLASPSRPTLRR